MGRALLALMLPAEEGLSFAAGLAGAGWEDLVAVAVVREQGCGGAVRLLAAGGLGGKGHHAGVVRTRADLAEPHHVAFDKQLHAKQAQPG